MISTTEPLHKSERSDLAKRVKRSDRQNSQEIRRYSLEELIDGLKARVHADYPHLNDDEVRKRALDRYARLKAPFAGAPPKSKPHQNHAHIAARKAIRQKMKGSR